MGASMCPQWVALTDFVQKRLEASFKVIGSTAARHPCRLILAAVLIAIAFSAGVVNLRSETDGTELWVARREGPYLDREIFRERYNTGDVRYPGLLLAVPEDADPSSSIITQRIFAHAVAIHKAVMDLGAIDGDRVINFRSVCERAWDAEGAPCVAETQSVLAAVGFSPILVANSTDEDIRERVAAAHIRRNLSGFLGGIVDNNGTILSAKSLVMRFPVAHPDVKLVELWEVAFLDLLDPDRDDPLVDSSIVQIGRGSRKGFDLELARLVSNDQPLFVLALIMIVVFLCFTLGKSACGPRTGRVMPAISVIVVVLLANAAAFGFVSMLGISVNSVCFLMPFISLGVGADDLIIIVDAFDRAGRTSSFEDQASKAMGNAGVAVTLTSLTSVIALAVGASTDYPGIQSFCAVASAAFLFKLILGACMMFPAFVVLDERRAEAGRHPCFCCWTRVPPRSRQSRVQTMGRSSVSPLSAHDMSASASGAALPMTELSGRKGSGRKSSRSKSGSGSRQQLADEELSALVLEAKPNPVQRFMSKHYAPWIAKKSNAVNVLLGFTVFTSLWIWSAAGISKGIPDTAVLPDDSYLLTFYKLYDTYFEGSRTNTMDIVVYDLDFSLQTERAKLTAIVDALQNEPFVIGRPDNFIDPMRLWAHNVRNLTDFDAIEPLDFYLHLAEFLEVSEFKPFRKSFAYDDQRQISAVRISAMFQDFTAGDLRLAQYNRIQTLLDDAQLGDNAFPLAGTYLYAYSEGILVELTLVSLGSALAAVLVCVMLFLDFEVSLWVGVCVLLIDVDLFGLAALWGVALSPVSFVTFVMSIGVSIDYCVHLGHAFAHHYGFRSDKVEVAVAEMGSSVLKGAFTSLVGVVVLAGASSDAFRTFFKMLFGAVVLGVLHGVVFLPAVLRVFGPGADATPTRMSSRSLHSAQQKALRRAAQPIVPQISLSKN